MRMIRQMLNVFLVVYGFSLFADEQLANPLTSSQSFATTEGLPSNLVNESVCVITGEYVDTSVDITLPGPESLVFGRTYSSSSINGNMGAGWGSNHRDVAYQATRFSREKPYENEEYFSLIMAQASGSCLEYHMPIPSKSYAKKHALKLTAFYPKGWTNRVEKMSGQTNLKNQQVYYFYGEDRLVSVSGAGNVSHYHKQSKGEIGDNFTQVLEQKVNGSCLTYEHDKKLPTHLKRISVQNGATKQLYSSLEFKAPGRFKDDLTLILKTSDDRELRYHFLRHTYKIKKKVPGEEIVDHYAHYYLEKVEGSHRPYEKYRYIHRETDKKLFLNRKEGPDHRFLKTSYYQEKANQMKGHIGDIVIDEKDDYRLDRVKSQSAPVGVGDESIKIYRFVYNIKNKKNEKGFKELLDGSTDVYDAYWHRTSYFFNKDHYLTSLKNYTGTNGHYSLYSTEKYIWGEKETSSEGNLLGKCLKDAKGGILHGCYFVYDKKGNILTKALYGHLTGLPFSHIVLDEKGKPTNQDCEREKTVYTYSDDGLNLLRSEKDVRGTTTLYDYRPGTNLVSSKLIVVNSVIQLREYYHYDQNAVLIKKIVDDGQGLDQNDLTGLSERHLTYYFPRTTAPFGLIERADEMYLDLATGEEKLLKRTLCQHSKEGYLLKQDQYDSEGNYCYSNTWKYDAHGNVKKETNALNESIIKKYDANNNLIYQTTTGSNFHIENTYDYANRLVRQEEFHEDGKQFATTHRYNYLNQCVSTLNPYGQETKQEYDEFGRVVANSLPFIANEAGELVQPIIRKQYDIAGNPTCLTDAKGRKTVITYNCRKQPTHIIHPNGAEERFYYELNGQLSQKIDKNGKRTTYIRDYQGRVLQEDTYAPDGQALKCQLWQYNAFHLLSSIDAEGLLTTYQYDSAGRLQLLIKGDQVKRHYYDSLGRVTQIKEWISSEPNDYRCYVKRYDWLDKVIEERIEAPDGTVLQCDQFGYDYQGNQISVCKGEKTTYTEYNSHGNPVKITDALGQTTYTNYNTSFFNAYQQRVLQTETTDPLGYLTVQTYDVANRLVEEKRLNPFGIITAHQHLFYDLCGNKVRIIDDVLLEGKYQYSIETLYLYTLDNQIEALVEAAWSPEQKVTRYLYNPYGQKIAKIKPDGSVLFYEYDAEGRLKSLKASDESIWYVYDYNKCDQVVKVTDWIRQVTTERVYDALGQMVVEKFENNLTMTYRYDRIGRAQFVLLPDQTGIEYVYNALDLKEIHRFIAGKRVYSHLDLAHHLSGFTKQSQLAGKNGVVNYQYDDLDRCIGIQTTAFDQHVPVDGYDAAGNLLTYQTQGKASSFSYDDLYQLKEERGHANHTYQSDSLANRTLKDGQVHSLNPLNQLLQRGEETYRYDANGNLKQKINGTDVTCYTYDALDRLIAVSRNGVSTTYRYDAFNRRMSKSQEDHPLQAFIYQGQEEIGVWEEGALTELKLLSKGKRNPAVAIELRQHVYVPVQDIFGHVACLLDLEGQVVERYFYTAFGEAQIFDQNNQRIKKSVVGNPWQYANKRWDAETGFVAFGLRYYDPDLGRWVTPDPTGFEDGPNLYAYVHNSPLIYYDQFGLFTDYLEMGMGFFQNLFSNPVKQSTRMRLCESNLPCKFDEKLGPFLVDGINNKDSRFFYKNSTTFSVNEFINPQTGKHFSFPERDNRWLMIVNGIGNSHKDCIDGMIYLAKLANYNVRGVYSASQNFFLDIYCCGRSLFNYVSHETVRELHKNWNEFFRDAPEDAILEMVCHSRGAIYTRNALMSYPPDLRKRIKVIAVAPGAYIDRGLCHEVLHLVSKRDFVPLLDFMGAWRCRDTVVRLSPHPNAAFLDHTFTSPTYQTDLKRILTPKDNL